MSRESEPAAISDAATTPVDDALATLLLERTPARVLVGEAGDAYRTVTQLELRRDHAAARDAVRRGLDLHADLGLDVVQRFGLFVVDTCCRDKDEYLLRPDLGRRLSDDARARVGTACAPGVDLQVVIGDGLSVAAVASQAAAVLEGLADAAAARGWSFGQPFCVRHWFRAVRSWQTMACNCQGLERSLTMNTPHAGGWINQPRIGNDFTVSKRLRLRQSSLNAGARGANPPRRRSTAATRPKWPCSSRDS